MKNKGGGRGSSLRGTSDHVSREGGKKDVAQEPQTAVTSVRVSARSMWHLREMAAH